MAKNPATTDLTGAFGTQGAINDSWDAIDTAFQNTLSLDGSTPNSMSADIDLGGNDVINVTNIEMTGSIVINGVNLVPNDAATIPSWEGPWFTTTNYVLNDMVSENGNTYICVVVHTSGTFDTDLGNNYWQIMASKGSTGAGTGDLLAANNLSDLDNVTTARVNLGTVIGTDVQAQQIYTLTTTGGTSSAFTATPPNAPSSYNTGDTYVLRFHTATAGSATLNINGIGAKSLKYYRQVGTQHDISSGGVQSNSICMVQYDGTDFIFLFGMNSLVDVFSGRIKVLSETDLATSALSHVPSQNAVKVYVDTLTGVANTWQNVTGTRSVNTAYQNITGGPIKVIIYGKTANATSKNFSVSSDDVTYLNIATINNSGTNLNIGEFTIPNKWYYKMQANTTVASWYEWRP